MLKNIQMIMASGEYEGACIPISTEEIILGRDPQASQLMFQSERVSRKHCSIRYDMQRDEVIFTNYSSSGTYINGQRFNVQGLSISIKNGDRIRLGDSQNEFTINYEVILNMSPQSSRMPMFSPESEMPFALTGGKSHPEDISNGNSRKKNKKKKLIIGLCCGIAIIAIVLGALYYFFFTGASRAQREIKKKIEEYAEAVENLDIGGFAGTYMFGELLMASHRADEWGGYDTDAEEESFKEEIEEEYEEWMEEYDELRREMKTAGLRIEIDSLEIGEIERIDINTILNDSSDVSLSKEDKDYICEFVEKAAKECEINLDELYCAEISYDINMSCDDKEEWHYEYDMDIDDAASFIQANVKYMYAYEYKGEYYVLPDILVTSVFSSYNEYRGRAARSDDVSNANTLSTAVMIALSSEEVYEACTKTIYYSDELYKGDDAFTKKTANILGGESAIPMRCEYGENAGSEFTVYIDKDRGEIIVYGGYNTDDFYKLYPETGEYYQ